MKILVYISLILCFSSCKSKDNTTNIETPFSEQKKVIDTTIIYTIQDLSSEGAEAKTLYKGNKIAKSEISIYGETGQIVIKYSFHNDTIDVYEKQFAYKEGNINLNSKNEMYIKKEFAYQIDTSGKLLKNMNSGSTDIFKEFKQAVPFKIK
ncbi:MAG: hypothetical protein R2831_06385 [Chitinophagaceae bacterium]